VTDVTLCQLVREAPSRFGDGPDDFQPLRGLRIENRLGSKAFCSAVTPKTPRGYAPTPVCARVPL